jgi:Cu-Zn family superoxide dismutase
MHRMGAMTAAILLLVTVVVAGGCAGARTSSSEPGRIAWAELKNKDGESVGSAVLRQEDGRVRIVVQARGLTPGRHGIHVHAVGRCEAPGFQSAGDHFNPLGQMHGLENPGGPHAGDLPNLEADASGRVEYVAMTDRVSLVPGPATVFDVDGSAIVVHETADDQRTDPSGNSGARLLCGALVAGPTTGFLPRP